MAAANYKLFIEQGSTLTRSVSLKNTDGTAYDLTGATIAGEIRQTATAVTKIIDLTVTISAPATLGQFTISLTATQTAGLPVVANTGPEIIPTLYAYDVQMTNGAVVTRLFQGEAIVSPQVTR